MSENLKMYCNSCSRTTNHEILKEEDREVHDDEVHVTFIDSWQIIKCLGCEEITFRHVSSNSDDYHPETREHYENIRVYPIRGDATRPMNPYYNAPPIVRSIYRETIDAYNNSLNLLCAAGLRSIIESICTHEKISDGPVKKKDKTGIVTTKKSKNLDGKINGLLEKGIITEKHVAILHEHRYLGNEALHSLDTPHKKILTTAIEIIEHTLDQLYEIDHKAGELIWSRELKEKKKRKT